MVGRNTLDVAIEVRILEGEFYFLDFYALRYFITPAGYFTTTGL